MNFEFFDENNVEYKVVYDERWKELWFEGKAYNSYEPAQKRYSSRHIQQIIDNSEDWKFDKKYVDLPLIIEKEIVKLAIKIKKHQVFL